MAILTYDPTPADQPEFNEAEQEALAIGEAQAAEEQQLLAGKFKDAEALEQAYIELQKKLGEGNQTSDESQPEEVIDEEEEEETNPVLELLNKASEEYYSNEGQLSQETFEALAQMDSKDLISAYIEAQQTIPANNYDVPDLTQSQVDEVRNFVGGQESYANIVGWAAENMPQNFIEAFDNVVNTGNVDMIKLAIAGLSSAFQEANGYEGRMLTGKNAQTSADVFRSQAEVVAAMQDPRYDRDPAYRADVFAKLDRSNLDY